MNEARASLPPVLRGVRAAFGFSTRLPVGGFPYRSEDLAWATAHGPAVGALLGAAAGAAFRALAPVGVPAAALLAVAFTLFVTGALHEDGLADTCDALGGGRDRARVLAILKDSRIGVFGGAALVVSIALRALLVARLGATAPWTLAVAFAAARVGPVWQAAILPYVTADGASKSRDLVRGGVPQAIVATAWGVLVLLAAAGPGNVTAVRALVLVAALVAVTALAGHRYRVRAGGVTGDFLGATEQLGEIASLVVLVWGNVVSVWLVRHAPVHLPGVCYGQIDVATSLDAEAAADAVERVFAVASDAPCSALFTSPWERTRELACRLAERWRVPLHVDARLSELAFGEWEGRPFAEIERTHADHFTRWLRDYSETPPPGGETAAALVARVEGWLREAVASPHTVLAVTHAGPIRAARATRACLPYAAHALDPVPFLHPEKF